MNREHLKAVLSQYLGPQFSVNLNLDEVKGFRKVFPSLRSAFIQGRQRRLRALGCYHLLEWGWQKYRLLNSYQLVDMFLSTGQTEAEAESFYDIEVPLLVVYHMAGTMENRQLENLVSHTVSQRNIMGLKTIVMAEVDLPKVENQYRELGLLVVKDTSSSSAVSAPPLL